MTLGSLKKILVVIIGFITALYILIVLITNIRGVPKNTPYVKMNDGLITEVVNCPNVKDFSMQRTCAQFYCEKRLRESFDNPSVMSIGYKEITYSSKESVFLIEGTVINLKDIHRPFRCVVTGDQVSLELR